MRSDVRHAQTASQSDRPFRLGLIVNPVAGLGGPVGLKGTDGAETLARARDLGARPVAPQRASRALRHLLPLAGRIALTSAPGDMGADLARDLGLAPIETAARPSPSTARHTQDAAAAMQDAGIDLILFAGGDGTARDILEGAPGARLLGIPSGVKMHSGVFGLSPDAAGALAARVVSGEVHAWRAGEVMDVDEDALRHAGVRPRLYGAAQVPSGPGLQHGKSRGGTDDEAALEALANVIVREMDPARLYILGCGTTVMRIKRRLGPEPTLLGVDVALQGRIIARDVDEARLLRLLAQAPASAILGVTGGQGFVFGRGNQQISPNVLRLVGRENITIVASADKLIRLDPPRLHADTGDPELDAMLAGYHRVRTAPGRAMMMRLSVA